ncbi:MAG: hypothetical protein NTY01_03255 [Verrucomicrobia bacterium]|nr:hypothetical protein [Verrucomicrobiota bacterium]
MTLKLFIDIQNRRLVTSFDSDTAATLRPWFQGDDVALEIYPLLPSDDVSQGPFVFAELASVTIRAALCGGTGKPTGSVDGPDAIAYQETFAPVPHGFAGTLSLATEEIAEHIGANPSATTTLEIEATDAQGLKTTLLQAPLTLNAEVIEVGTLAPALQPQYFTKTESDARYVWNRADITALTGGGSGKLDGIVTAALVLNILIQTAADGRLYTLRAGTDAENSPVIIRPDDYNADTNARVWELFVAVIPSRMEIRNLDDPETRMEAVIQGGALTAIPWVD